MVVGVDLDDDRRDFGIQAADGRFVMEASLAGMAASLRAIATPHVAPTMPRAAFELEVGGRPPSCGHQKSREQSGRSGNGIRQEYLVFEISSIRRKPAPHTGQIT